MIPARVLVLGGANIDLVAGVPHCPRPGESLIGHDFKTVPGGKGANQAVAAARLGAQTYFAGCVGADSFGELQHAALKEAGVDVTYLKTDPHEPTGTAIICVEDSGQNTIVVILGANASLAPDDIFKMELLFRNIDVFVTQLESSLPTVTAALAMARNHGVLTILDAGPAQRVPLEILALADIASPNETEAEAITGITINSLEDALAAAQRIREMGAREVVLKLGAMGSLYFGETSLHVPAFQVEPIDTVAAGDAFTAALATVWKRLPPYEALRYANAAGALATTVAGAQPSMPNAATVATFLDSGWGQLAPN